MISDPSPGAPDDDAKRFNRVIRTHWAIEYRVH
jgi:predicted transposase YbfD/YdcC